MNVAQVWHSGDCARSGLTASGGHYNPIDFRRNIRLLLRRDKLIFSWIQFNAYIFVLIE